MRVLLVDLERDWRGGQEQALLLMRGLRARGHSAELVALENGALAARVAAEQIHIHPVCKSFLHVNTIRRMRRLLARQTFEIVHANEPHAVFASFFALAQRRSKFIIARRVAFTVPRDWFHLIRYRAAARIIAVSKAVREDLLAARLDPPGVDVVADGVEVPEPVSSEERGRARDKRGLEPDERVLSFVASFTEEKGHALLLEAFHLVKQMEPKCRLLLAGDGPLRATIEQRAHEAGLGNAVIFAGFVEDVRAIYAASDAFIFPALIEGAGSSLLGAMACGLPVAALARGGVPEIVEDGRNGLLVQEAAAEPLANAALRLIQDKELAGRLARSGRETVAQRFSADRMVEDTLRVFERLTGIEPAVERVLA